MNTDAARRDSLEFCLADVQGVTDGLHTDNDMKDIQGLAEILGGRHWQNVNIRDPLANLT